MAILSQSMRHESIAVGGKNYRTLEETQAYLKNSVAGKVLGVSRRL